MVSLSPSYLLDPIRRPHMSLARFLYVFSEFLAYNMFNRSPPAMLSCASRSSSRVHTDVFVSTLEGRWRYSQMCCLKNCWLAGYHEEYQIAYKILMNQNSHRNTSELAQNLDLSIILLFNSKSLSNIVQCKINIISKFSPWVLIWKQICIWKRDT